MRLNAAFTAYMFLVAFTAFSQNNSETISTNPYEGLVDIIMRLQDSESAEKGEMAQYREHIIEETDSLKPFYDIFSFIEDSQKNDSMVSQVSYSGILSDIINTYYPPTDVKSKKSNGVLAYVESVFSEHGYHDAGGWVRPQKLQNWKSHRVHKGKLPEYGPDDFRLPVEGSLTSLYGYRPKFGRIHHGIDVAVNMGDTVCCVLPGVVTLIGYEQGGYGRYVVVSHAGDLETLYGHLSASMVTLGQTLQAGEALGLVGNTGNSTGPHLHFETRRDGLPFDPIPFFNLSGRFSEVSAPVKEYKEQPHK